MKRKRGHVNIPSKIHSSAAWGLMPAEAFRAWVILLSYQSTQSEPGRIPPAAAIAYIVRRPENDVGEFLKEWQAAGLVVSHEGVLVTRDAWQYFRSDNRPSSKEWEKLRKQVFERDGYTCRYCGKRGGRLECDHVVPVSRNGSHDAANLATACFKCNRAKRDHLVGDWAR